MTTVVVYVVVGALVCGIKCSGFKFCFVLFFFFSLIEIFISSCEPFQHGVSIACCIKSHKLDKPLHPRNGSKIKNLWWPVVES